MARFSQSDIRKLQRCSASLEGRLLTRTMDGRPYLKTEEPLPESSDPSPFGGLKQLRVQHHVKKNKRSGLPMGVTLARGRFVARIVIQYHRFYLGSYGLPETAGAAYQDAKNGQT